MFPFAGLQPSFLVDKSLEMYFLFLLYLLFVSLSLSQPNSPLLDDGYHILSHFLCYLPSLPQRERIGEWQEGDDWEGGGEEVPTGLNLAGCICFRFFKTKKHSLRFSLGW